MDVTPPSSLRAILLSILGIALGLLIICLMIFFLVSRRGSPSDLLPADQTVALFIHPTEEDLQSYASWFPILASMPALPGKLAPPTHVAIVHLPNGRDGWVILQESLLPHDIAGRTAIHRGGFSIVTSEDAVEALLESTMSPLSAKENYSAFAGQFPETASWAYLQLRFPPANMRTPVDAMMATVLQHSPFIAMTRNGKTSSIGFYLPAQKEWPGIRRIVTSFAAHPLLIASLGAPNAMLAAALSLLPQEQQTMLTGLLRHTIDTLVGNDVSPQYDLLPLLQEPAVLSLHADTQNRTLWIAEGSLRDVQDLKRRIELLHHSAEALTPGFTVRERTLDHNFTSTILTSVAGAGATQTSTLHGWTVRSTDLHAETPEVGTGSITSALQGSRFLLGTDASWVTHAVNDDKGASIVLPASLIGSGTPIAGGFADVSALRSWAQTIGLSLESILFPSIASSEGGLLWAVEQSGPVVTLTVTDNVHAKNQEPKAK